MKYPGTGKIKFQDQEFKVIVNLDPESGFITAKFPLFDDINFFELYKKRDFFEKKYTISDLKIYVPNGIVERNKLDNLYIKSINPGTFSIYDSSLIRAFNLSEKEIGISTITFFLSNSLQEFDFSEHKPNKYSELVFLDNGINSPILHLKIKGNRYTINCDKSVLIVRSTVNLLNKQPNFYRAFSLLQGGRITYRTGFFKKRLQINFVKAGEFSRLGQLFKDDNLKIEFIEKLFLFEENLINKDKRKRKRYELFIEYLLEALSAKTTLENRLISLYTAIEIIDDSKTLTKQSVSSLFKIDQNLADIIIRVRNKIIHEGYELYDSIVSSIEAVKKYSLLKRVPFGISNRSKRRASFNFYIFLVTMIYRKIFKNINLEVKKDELLLDNLKK